MAVGIPLYVCATASVPIAAAMILKGVSPGAAFVFLMTGPATNAAAVAILWKLLGRRATIVYLATIAVSALLLGLLLDWLFVAGGSAPAMTHGAMLPRAAHVASAVALLVLLVIGMWPRRLSAAASAAIPAPCVFRISGMTCSHCAESVKDALQKVPGVQAVTVDLSPGVARVEGTGYSFAEMKRALAELGFGIEEA
jgi:hypothetical protein